MGINIDNCVEQVLETGYCLLPNHFPQNKLEQCNAAFLSLLEDIAQRIPEGNRGPNRWANGLPFAPPFYHSEFFNDDTVNEIVQRIFGEKMHISYYGLDTPTKDTGYQSIHRDVAPLFHECPDRSSPPYLLSIRFPFVEMTVENGPFEVTTGTQHLPKDEAIAKAESGEIPLNPLLLKLGDVIISDPRAVHRGTPNRTNDPRPFAVICYNRPWHSVESHTAPLLANEDATKLTESFYQSLSAREQHLLRRIPRASS